MASSAQLPKATARALLENVPRVGFYDGGDRCPEDITFPSCLRACLEFMGDNLGCEHIRTGSSWGLNCGYAYLLGTSGAAFQLSWKPGWHSDNVDITHMSDDPLAPFRRAFASAGYACEIVTAEQGRDNEAYYRERIIESIRDRGRPVLAFGVIGPPECCIIAGYDEHGQVLIGWNFFQNFPEFSSGIELEPSGYFRRRDWFPDTKALIAIGERRERPTLRDTYREALCWALNVIRTPVTGEGQQNGLAAYTAWADHLQQDDAFPADELTILRERHMVHDNAVGMVAECRWYGSLFLAQIARHEWTMASHLLAAASCYAAEHELMWQIWDRVGGIGRSDVQVRSLADPDIRRLIVPLIYQAREREAEAADHIERALG